MKKDMNTYSGLLKTPDKKIEPPRGNLEGFRTHWRQDLTSGLLVFLIALPLCLGISIASGYPPIAGIFTAIIGGILGSLLSSSEMTIKGPAAGLIVIALGAVTELGGGDPTLGYKLALGVGVVAGLLQIVFALMRAGALGDFFPSAAVHGMLAAIGIIIASKQIHIALGVKPEASNPIALIAEIPASIGKMVPSIAVISIISLLILFMMPRFKAPWIKKIPGPVLVVLSSIPLGIIFGLSTEHDDYVFGHTYHIDPARYLVSVPDSMLSAITFPDFSAITSSVGIKYVLMFALVGTLESILSAKAVDMLDPYERKTDFNRDSLAVGVGNTLSSFIGGLPMISEIVRSSANINNGGRTRFANVYHGLFLLVFVAFAPGLIRLLPHAALASMLIFTGLRLASPKEFIHAYHVGREQFAIFVLTTLTTLATDLLVGIAVGIVAEVLVHLLSGASIKALIRANIAVSSEMNEAENTKTTTLRIQSAAIFTNWLSINSQIKNITQGKLILDFSNARIIDHTVMSRIQEVKRDFKRQNRLLEICGMDQHKPFSAHPCAARRLVA
jgi:MFS superfamily sulfate permease-like transporter